MVLGVKRFLAIYMGCGVSGSLTSALFNRWNESKHRMYQYNGHVIPARPTATQGASGK
jgi:membrane associated rhomboid family serine protease